MTNFNILTILVLLCLGNVPLSLAGPLDDPDVGLNTVQIIQNHGYVCETHTITTEDGYILTYHRIPHGINDTSTDSKPVALFMHGATASSADFVNMGPDRSLGYILADLGYDVWLANARGNAWCRNHTTLDVVKDAAAFFDFSWHEMGYYDVPAAIDYILNLTLRDDLFYVGHSVGTSVFLVLATTRPEYNSKIKLASLMAPISSMENQSNDMLLFIAQFIDEISAAANGLEIYEIPFLEEIRRFAVDFCSVDLYYPICEAVIFQAVGADEPELDQNKIAVLLTNTPSNSALKQFYHYAQLIKNGGFSQYDYGTEKNLEIYGTETPTPYDLSKISAPVALYYGKNDIVVNVKDVEQLVSKLPNVANDYLVPYELFNHFDFTYAIHIIDLVYNKLISVMGEHM